MLSIFPLGTTPFGETETPSEGTAPTNTTVSGVTVTPTTATGSRTFTASVQGTNSPSQGVTWSIAQGGGTVTSGGGFTEPAKTYEVQTVKVRATSVADPSYFAEATVTIAALTATPLATVTGVTVTPNTATGSRTFTASVQGSNDPSQAVTWGIIQGGGSVTSGGMFTAPVKTSAIQIVKVRATSNVNPTYYAEATVTIEAGDPSLAPVYPTPDQVLIGTVYGPTGVEHIGTMVSTGPGPTPAQIAEAVWAHQIALSIPQYLGLK